MNRIVGKIVAEKHGMPQARSYLIRCVAPLRPLWMEYRNSPQGEKLYICMYVCICMFVREGFGHITLHITLHDG
jgi:hypothetical protein